MAKTAKTLKAVAFVAAFLFVILSVHPGRFAARYPFVPQELLMGRLAKRINRNVTFRGTADCDYAPVLADWSDFRPREDFAPDTNRILPGGERAPDCRPLFSVAIVVPYRDRHDQLKRFLTYMHAFLPGQRLHYRLYVVEQEDAKPFNRAKLLNVGATAAIADGYPCLVLHDVDLLPLRNNNIYACTDAPRHMSSSVDKFRFNLPYESLFGGAVAVLADQFVAANGMSNNYFGWGAEDDDLHQRLDSVGLTPCRLDPRVSAYTMMKHKPETASSTKNNLLATARMRHSTDGLNSLKFVEKSRKLHALFTHIVVAL